MRKHRSSKNAGVYDKINNGIQTYVEQNKYGDIFAALFHRHNALSHLTDTYVVLSWREYTVQLP